MKGSKQPVRRKAESYKNINVFVDTRLNFLPILFGFSFGRFFLEHFLIEKFFGHLCNLSSLSLMTCVFLPKTWHTAITSAAMCGKFFITGGFAIAYVYSAELYPTTLRNNGVGINSIFGRIGALMSPAVLLMGELWWLKALFASLSLLCLLASLGKVISS